MAAIKSRIRALACVSVVFLPLSKTLCADNSKGAQRPTDANQLVRAVIDNELKIDQQDHTHWMYRQQSQDGGKTTAKEIVEARDCDLDYKVSANGKPLTAEERQKEEDRLNKLVTDRSEQEKKMKAAQDDANKATDLFKMLPDAFRYEYSTKTRSLVKLTFKPNPDFHPPSREAQVFHAMEGTMWVNAKELRLAELEGQLSEDVQFLGGLVGHLNKGGRFSVKRTEVAAGHWETTQLDVHMNGKVIIFKSINLQQSDSMTNFRQVPGDLSATQAADMLRKVGAAGAHNELAATGTHDRLPN